MPTLTSVLNSLAGTTGLDATGAANDWAGTTGLALPAALYAKAVALGMSPPSHMDTQGILNFLAGTTGLAPDGAASALQLPLTMGNLAVWYDARYPAGFGGALPADGTALAQWNDLSGNGRHATQGTGSKQPLFRSANPNLLTYNQATVETDTTGLAALNGNSTIARSTTDAAHGTASLQVTSVAAGLTGANTLTGTSGVPVSPSTQYTALISAKAPTITANWTPIIYWWKSDGSASATPTSAGSAGALTTSYAQRSITAISPSDAAFASVAFQWTAVAASEVVRADCLGIFPGTVSTWVPPVTLSNGLPTVQFDGVGDSVQATIPVPSPTSTTIYTVGKLDVNASVFCIRIVGGSSFYLSCTGNSWQIGGLLGTNPYQDMTTTWSQTVIVSWVLSGTSSAIYSNGALHGAASSVAPASGAPGTGLQLGAGSWKGEITSVLMYSTAHTTAQRQAVERWLGQVFNIAVA